jgi:demethylmenaquinone methyltransferase/2-methoxy-6-polyprenyl-1,4-benzoquinol methylase
VSRLSAFRSRTERYLREGHDRFAAARFVAGSVGEGRASALDVGTGKGLLALALAERGLDVVSVDVSLEDQEVAAALALEAGLSARIRFLLADASALPFPDGAFACAAMMDVLHHLADAGPVLAEMARVVAPSGRLVVADFTEEGFDLVARIHREEGKEHPRSAATVGSARAALLRAGMRDLGSSTGQQQDVSCFERTSSG